MNSCARVFWWMGGILISTVCVILIWASYQFRWANTGFLTKTLWDWLDLLIIPVVLAAAALFFNWANTRTERQIARERYEQDQTLALDKQREDLLQSYLDRMSELFLEKGLRTAPADAEVRKVARTRTVTTLLQLDGKRAGAVFTFLSEAGLTVEPDPIIGFEQANLAGIKWHGASLRKINLGGADLSGADLGGADLGGADLGGANLSKADLSGANLSDANLSKADLSEANLSDANPSKTDLSYANLSGANLHKTRLYRTDLREANLSRANLHKAKLDGTDLRKAKLYKADLHETEFEGSDLREASLYQANLSYVFFSRTDLSYANLSHAKLMGGRCIRQVSFEGTNLSYADLRNTFFPDSDVYLHKTDLRDAKGLRKDQVVAYQAKGAITGSMTSI